MTELTRANKVTVSITDEGYVANFYKTHRHIASINSSDTDWEADKDTTKIGQRESFRAYVIANADKYGISWNPADMRRPDTVRKPVYTNDVELADDVVMIASDYLKELVGKCKYGVEWGGIEVDDIIPMTKTPRGIDLSKLGVTDGKYNNSGNWAWANIQCAITVKYNKSEIYIPITTQLVSGQLRKPKMSITTLTNIIHDEIINAKLATEDVLNPPKKNKSTDNKEKEKKTTKTTRKRAKKPADKK